MSDKKEGLFLRLLMPLDERVSVKLLLRVWGPRFEFVVRLILVATFLDDSFRTATHFFDHTKQVAEQGCLQWLAPSSPDLAGVIATVALGNGLIAQSVGSVCLLALVQPDGATKALIGWAVAQPVLYAQLGNVALVAESLSLVGGLLMLRAHLLAEQAKKDDLASGGLRAPGAAARAAISRTQLLGRLLLPTYYLYHAGLLLLSVATPETTDSASSFVASLSTTVVNAAVLVGLVLGCALVAAGLKSRTVALSLALVNLAFVCYQYPFYRFAWLEGGVWKYDEAGMRKSMPQFEGVDGIEASRSEPFEPWQIYDLNRYYFFQGLSASGALLLLAQFGPGKIAVEENEVILPVMQRAQD